MNTHEATARIRKALALADALRILTSRTGASIEDIEQLPEPAWVTVAQVAGVRAPSLATRAMVLELLRHGTCGLGSNGLACGLPRLHPSLHDWEDPIHAARVEAFLDAQDAAKGAERRAS